ncbi:hypothetical protein GCM10014719_44090 [Planomonospora parontospora subsp. antibiotica]|nr:hypothetical protein GCM10014719_44090 [Planomonospora parontospora subsp. antibiotica]GII17615.1 hypothetical protein Ppa05_43410 [Planomonospora parontospora subsp. antibiotica]
MFYRYVGRRLGQPDIFAQKLLNPYIRDDPLRHWVRRHRKSHAEMRVELWQRHHANPDLRLPFPEIRHFK